MGVYCSEKRQKGGLSMMELLTVLLEVGLATVLILPLIRESKNKR